jgi:hypothetical protein
MAEIGPDKVFERIGSEPGQTVQLGGAVVNAPHTGNLL